MAIAAMLEYRAPLGGAEAFEAVGATVVAGDASHHLEAARQMLPRGDVSRHLGGRPADVVAMRPIASTALRSRSCGQGRC